MLLYSINQQLTANVFEINSSTGELKVKDLSNSIGMDRDSGTTQHIISINIDDNEGRGIFLSNSTTITLILLDCNDNAPEMPETLTYPTIFESLSENSVVVTDFYAPDKDEGLNSQVDYEIESSKNFFKTSKMNF